MTSILVGSTGFVGSNLTLQMRFDACFHSADIECAFDMRPGLCVYAGMDCSRINGQ